MDNKEIAKVGQGKAMKEGWIAKDKDTFKAKVRRPALTVETQSLTGIQVDSIVDTSREQLLAIQKTRTHSKAVISDLKRRKLVTMQKVIIFEIDKGPKYAIDFVKEETDLTADMLAR